MDPLHHTDRLDSTHSYAQHEMAGGHGRHDRHAGHSVAMFRDKFWLSLLLTIPTVVWSPDVQHWFGYTAPSFPGSTLIPPVLGTIIFIYGGLVFMRGAIGEIAGRQPGMMTLISLGIVVAFGTSLAGTLGLLGIEVWWELASLITIMLLGHWLEMRAVSQARGALDALAALLPDTAERIDGAEVHTVPLHELKVGDIVLVRPGTRVPADGIVVDGSADVDESMITANPDQYQKGLVRRLLRERSRAAEVSASALPQSVSRRHSPASCDSLPQRNKLPPPVRKRLPIVLRRSCFMSQ